MRHEIIKLNSEFQYKDILKFLKELGEPVFNHLGFHNEFWHTLLYDNRYSHWSLVRSTDLALNSTNSIPYSDFISKYSKKEETIDYKHTVYIKGNLTRGNEVIQKLIDLGGKECTLFGGDGVGGFYFIDKENTICFNMDFNLTKNKTELFLDEPVNEPINKVEVFPGIYVGDVVVSLKTKNYYRKIGDIFKVLGGSKKNVLDYNTHRVYSTIADEWRLATSEEKKAFEKGITNINDIKKEPEEDFSKFIGQWVTYHKWSKKSVCKVIQIQKRESKDDYKIHFDKGYINVKPSHSTCAYWSANVKNLKILSKEELKDYLPEDVYRKEFPETVKSTSLQDYLKSIPDTFTNDLEGFPKEIVQKIVERQVEQGNEPDYTVFEKELTAPKERRGFDWMYSKEDYDFWKEVIVKKYFNRFFEKYPKTETKVTTTNVYNINGILYGIKDSEGNAITFDTKDIKMPVVTHLPTDYTIKPDTGLVSYSYDGLLIGNPCYEIPLENKTTTFEHLPFIQVKPLEIF
jgi:hypothetical protein